VSGKVRIKGDSPTLQKDTKFTWSGLNLPLDVPVFGEFNHTDLSSTVSECVPYSRLGWLSLDPSTIQVPCV
jgi:hypothetical protein